MPDRIKKLEAIGFEWNPKGAAWNQMFAALVDYRRKHGHCNVPQTCSENASLGRWVSWQRYLRKSGKLGEARVHQLEEIGFAWEIVDVTWEEKFAALKNYKHNHGDCNVPQKWAENPELGTWVAAQRQARKKGKLSDEYISRLNDLDFAWDAVNEKWEEMFARLVKYKLESGNCHVPRESAKHSALARWLTKQRAATRLGKLDSERRAQLEQVGVISNPIDAAWEEMFSLLSRYKTRHGDCNVPQRWTENQRLANWVCNQRQFKRKGSLSKARIARLEQHGFVWNPISDFWEKMFAALVDHKRKHGHCNVPTKWKENRQLASWVVNQRSRRALLGEDRIRRLEEAGFQWQLHGITKDR